MPSCGCIGKVCFRLSHPEAEFGIFDDDERIAFAYLLILCETYLLDESRYTGVDRGDVLFHLCIVGIFDISQMDESGTNINDTSGEEAKNKNIVYQLLSFSCNHDESVFKGLNLTELFSDEMFL